VVLSAATVAQVDLPADARYPLDRPRDLIQTGAVLAGLVAIMHYPCQEAEKKWSAVALAVLQSIEVSGRLCRFD
jgi:hypothetical protein